MRGGEDHRPSRRAGSGGAEVVEKESREQQIAGEPRIARIFTNENGKFAPRAAKSAEKEDESKTYDMITVSGLCRRRGDNMKIAEAERNFSSLVNKVYAEGISVDLERGDKVIARLTPVQSRSPLTIGELNAFLLDLPPLGEDADEFSRDVRAIRAEF